MSQQPEGPSFLYDPTPDIQIVDPRILSARPIELPAGLTQGVLVGGGCRIMGWAFRESSNAAAARLELRENGNAAGILVAPINFIPSESTREWFPPAGIEATQLFFIITSGAVVGTVYVASL